MNRSVDPPVEEFGVTTAWMPGALRDRLAAVRAAGLGQLMLSMDELAADIDGTAQAIHHVRRSALKVAALGTLRSVRAGGVAMAGGLEHEGIACGSAWADRFDHAAACSALSLAARLGGRTLIFDVASLPDGDERLRARCVRRLAMLAIPLGMRIACSLDDTRPSMRTSADAMASLQRIVDLSDAPNVALALRVDATSDACSVDDVLDAIDPMRVLLIRVADPVAASPSVHGGRHADLLPGWGDRAARVATMVRAFDRAGYRGAWILDATHAAYRSMTLDAIAGHARASAIWLGEGVLRRSAPLPGSIRRFRMDIPGEPA